jgi:two-component system, sensor histidine kinase RegB
VTRAPRVLRVSDEPQRIQFDWLNRLRFFAIAGQIVTICIVEGLLGVRLPVGPLLTIVVVELAMNVACVVRALRPTPIGEGTLAAGLAFDVLVLTALLYFTGGPFNPTSSLYLVHIALAAGVLRPRWTWLLVALSAGSFALLFVRHVYLADVEQHMEHMTLHVRGMWVAYALTAGLTVYFVGRVRQALAQREAELDAARELGERQARLASLATLAAGAAHELATPLATIATAAKELARSLTDGPAAEDARLIRAQVDRCSAILNQMTEGSGVAAGEAMAAVTVRALLDASLDGLEAGRVAVDAAPLTLDALACLPLRPVARSLRAVVNNALDAGPLDMPVALRCRVSAGALTIEVEDSGPGMAADVLARIGEPFFTTKPPGRGMGLGLFLTRNVVEGLGGGLAFDSLAGRGTCVRMTLPARAVL